MTDNRVGLPPSHRDGIGLKSMRERAAELGGNLAITSTPGHGAQITADLTPTPGRVIGPIRARSGMLRSAPDRAPTIATSVVDHCCSSVEVDQFHFAILAACRVGGRVKIRSPATRDELDPDSGEMVADTGLDGDDVLGGLSCGDERELS